MKKPSCDIHASYSRGCSECNRVYHAALNAALAQAMGCHVILREGSSSRHSGTMIITLAPTSMVWFLKEAKGLPGRYQVPDFCNDAAASRQFVLWLAEQDDEIRSRFEAELERAVAPYGGFMILDVLLAPLPTIAQAAAKALGLEVSND